MSIEKSNELMVAVRDAASALARGETGLLAYRRNVARALRQRFDASMASFWRLDGEAGSRRLRCLVAFTDDAADTLAGAELGESALQGYLDALAHKGIVNSPDAPNDPLLAGMAADYLVPQGVFSLLDVAIRVNGQVFGVLCIEQRERPQRWNDGDEVDLRKAAATISLALGREWAGTARSLSGDLS